MKETFNKKQPTEDKDKDTSAYVTPVYDQATDSNGSLSITSNIHNMIKNIDDEEGTKPNLMEVHGNAKRIKKRGFLDLIICDG